MPTIDQLELGGHGQVVEVASEQTSRLKALGICQGRRVELVRAGDPVIVRVLGSRVGLSAHLARTVQVRVGA